MHSDIKRDIRELQKIKKNTRKRSELRRKINRQIRALKQKIKYETSPEKEELIKKITKYNIKTKSYWKQLKINLKEYTLEQLRHHYETKIKEKE